MPINYILLASVDNIEDNTWGQHWEGVNLSTQNIWLKVFLVSLVFILMFYIKASYQQNILWLHCTLNFQFPCQYDISFLCGLQTHNVSGIRNYDIEFKCELENCWDISFDTRFYLKKIKNRSISCLFLILCGKLYDAEHPHQPILLIHIFKTILKEYLQLMIHCRHIIKLFKNILHWKIKRFSLVANFDHSPFLTRRHFWFRISVVFFFSQEPLSNETDY